MPIHIYRHYQLNIINWGERKFIIKKKHKLIPIIISKFKCHICLLHQDVVSE